MNTLSNANSSSIQNLSSLIANSDIEGLLNLMEAKKANHNNPSVMKDPANAYRINEEMRAIQKALDMVEWRVDRSEFERAKRSHNFKNTGSAKAQITVRDKFKSLAILIGF